LSREPPLLLSFLRETAPSPHREAFAFFSGPGRWDLFGSSLDFLLLFFPFAGRQKFFFRRTTIRPFLSVMQVRRGARTSFPPKGPRDWIFYFGRPFSRGREGLPPLLPFSPLFPFSPFRGGPADECFLCKGLQGFRVLRRSRPFPGFNPGRPASPTPPSLPFFGRPFLFFFFLPRDFAPAFFPAAICDFWALFFFPHASLSITGGVGLGAARPPLFFSPFGDGSSAALALFDRRGVLPCASPFLFLPRKAARLFPRQVREIGILFSLCESPPSPVARFLT